MNQKSFLLLFVFLLFSWNVKGDLWELHDANAVMSGISNEGQNKNKPYVAAGDRIYLIGTQDGNFPDMGSHVEGEMGGLWLHPIKLVDGFWARIKDNDNGASVWLSEADKFINYPHGNRLKYASVLNGIEIDRFQFCPDGELGIVIEYSIRNRGAGKRNLKFEFAVKTDLSPVWLSEQIGIEDQNDVVTWEESHQFFNSKDNGNPWYAIWGTVDRSVAQSIGTTSIPENTKGKGTAASSEYSVTLDKDSTTSLTFVIAGSPSTEKEAIHAYRHLLKNHSVLLEKKKKRYVAILNRARIKIPDPGLLEVYNWVKVNNQWLVREVPGIGRGLGAGLMEYPWWFGCDNTYALQAVMASGDLELVKDTLRLLKNQSMKKNGNGRIIHEVSTNGVVYNPGNTQETAHFIMCVEELFRWTGDLDFIREMYPIMKMGIQWLLNDMDQNKNLFPEGYGIMEVYGLNAELIDVAVYTQQALRATAKIARILNEPEKQKEYDELANQLEAKINREFWDESEGSYTDFYGSKQQAILAAEGSITQIKRENGSGLSENDQRRIAYYEKLKQKFAAMPEISKGWNTNKNWVINTPMESGIAPLEKAIPLLNKIRKEHVGEYGPYLSAVERNAMMTISTGVQAVAEAMYGRADEALWYVNRIVETFNRVLPGSISEMMPDYGCFTQAWTGYGIVVPVVQHIFGVYPDAYNKTIVLEPNLPTGWKEISIENLPVGTNQISFSRSEKDKRIEYFVDSEESGWNLVLKIKHSLDAKYLLDGREIVWDPKGFELKKKKNHLIVIPL